MIITDQKKQIRTTISEAKKKFSIEKKIDLSINLFDHIEKLEQFKKANTILLYYSLKDEVQTEFFIKKWHKIKRIILPVVDGDNLLLKEYNPEHIGRGYQSIIEPQQQQTIPVSEVEFAIIPGIAFDLQYNRLGRGKGFYDRFLSEVKSLIVGVCFEIQIVNKIPIESFDRPMDLVVTENGIKQFKEILNN